MPPEATVRRATEAVVGAATVLAVCCAVYLGREQVQNPTTDRDGLGTEVDYDFSACRPFDRSMMQERSGWTDPSCARVVALESTMAKVEVLVDWSPMHAVARKKFAPRGQTNGAALKPALQVDVLAGPKQDVRIRQVEIDHVQSTGSVQRYIVEVEHLDPDSDYTVQAYGKYGVKSWQRLLTCRYAFATPETGGNLVGNPSFEQGTQSSKYVATRFTKYHGTARMWTPFYTGGYVLGCGLAQIDDTGQDADYVAPRSGNCSLLLGVERTRSIWAEKTENFYGAHQAVAIPPTLERSNRDFILTWWYRPIGMSGDAGETFSIQISWQYGDGRPVEPAVVPMNVLDTGAWQRGCAAVRNSPRGIRMIHIFFHLHQRKGQVLIDDVDLRPSAKKGDEVGCWDIAGSNALSEEAAVTPQIHLKAERRPTFPQLTLAVAMTADRIMRLEAVAKAYGGGPVVVAVLVDNDGEIELFNRTWSQSQWLRSFADVQFVRDEQHTRREGILPINALRNIAIRLAQTEFVLLVDVDLTPGQEAFKCLRDPEGVYLRSLLPPGSKSAFIVPVFITDTSHRAPVSKRELLNALKHRTSLPYCLNSQMGTRFERWYSAKEPYEVRFETDYEPYAVVRKDDYPAYDERFVGYGFNKVAWVIGAQASGFRLFVLPGQFLFHLNHLENDWVQHISKTHYLKTWRRYFAYTGELATEGFLNAYHPPALGNESVCTAG